MNEINPIAFSSPWQVSDLRANRWIVIPRKPGVYRWYFPSSCLDSLGISSHCDLEQLNLAKLENGMVSLYFGIAGDLLQRVNWHAAQRLRPSALRSGFLSTFRLSLLALTNTDYATGELSLDSFMDKLAVSWAVTSSKSKAEEIEQDQLAGEYHYPINLQHNRKPEVAKFRDYLSALRSNYKRTHLSSIP